MNSKKLSRRAIISILLLIITAVLIGTVWYLWSTPEEPAEIILLQK